MRYLNFNAGTLTPAVLIALLPMLSACTFVCIKGDHNSVSDTREYGGLSLPDHSGAQQTRPLQRFIHPQH